MMRIRTVVSLACGAMTLTLLGCSQSDPTADAPSTQPVEVASPGSAPTYGKPSGMGFSTGDAMHSDGQGSGLMGYHGTGAAGTSGAITDKHLDSRQPPPGAATQPVLPPA